MIENRPKRILIAPLDWGLGHTTRCLPIISYLQRLGHQVIVACNTWQRTFIEKSCKQVEFTHIDGYNISYSAKDQPGKAANAALIPKILRAIKAEHNWLSDNLADLKIDGIISDNRYGLYSSTVPCVVITHQLLVQTGMGAGINRVVQRIHYTALEKFNEVWVPDVAEQLNLAGELSHPARLPRHTKYMGLLSQFEQSPRPVRNEGYLLVLLSGPEPQRSMLSDALLLQLEQYKGDVIFVAGNENASVPAIDGANIRFHRTLSGHELAEVVAAADMIICRSGYSTIMDLVLLGKKAVLIPTPGQTEQEYLAKHLNRQCIFPYCTQKSFNLNKELEKARNFQYSFPVLQKHYSDYQRVIDDMLLEI